MKLRLSYFEGERDKVPKVLEPNWDALVAQLTSRRDSPCTAETCGQGEHALVVDGKMKGCRHKYVGAWSPASYPPGLARGKKNVGAVSALVLDLDHLTEEQLVAAADRLEAYRYVAHATHGDRPGDRALRVVVALSRPVAGADWDRFWPAAIAHLDLPLTSRKGGTGGADRQTSDASRLYFLPTRPGDLDFLTATCDGAPLDVDLVMSRAAPPAPEESAPPPDLAPVAPEDDLRAAALSIAAAWPAPGGRHVASLALCGALARSGWPEESIARFVGEVSVLAGGEAEIESKRRPQAASSIARVAAGEHVSSWGTVAAALTRPGAVDEARARLGIRDAAADAVGEAFSLGTPLPESRQEKTTPTIADAYPDLSVFSLSPVPPAPPPDPGTYAWHLEAARADVTRMSGGGDAREDGPLFQPARDFFSPDYRAAPTEWLVESLVSRGGVAVIGSEPKSAKSWLATEIAASVASGTTALGRFRVPRACTTAYFYAEDLGPSVRNRLRAFARGRGVRPEDLTANLHVQPRGRHLDLTRDEDLARILASCRMIGAVELLVLDPLRDVHSGKENESDDMAEVFRRVRLLGDALGCTVLIVHHAKKPSKEQAEGRPGQDLRGSSAIYGSVDSGIYLRDLRGDGECTFTNTVQSEVKGARSAGKFELTLRIEDGPDGTAERAEWTSGKTGERALANADPGVADELVARVVQYLARSEVRREPPPTNDKIRAELRAKSDVVSAVMIRAARDDRFVERHLVGKKHVGWKLTDAGREFARAVTEPSRGEDPPAIAPGTILGPGAS